MNIVVTGCSSGIGAEVLKYLIFNTEHKVFGIARRKELLDKIELTFKDEERKRFLGYNFDLTNFGKYNNLIDFLTVNFQKIDILINNAGILYPANFEEIDFEKFDKMFHVNFKAPFFLTKLMIPLFNSPSHIVNISSMGGVQGSVKFNGLSAYSSSKGALNILTECLAEELKEKNIYVNAIALGTVQTEMLKLAFPGYKPSHNASQIAEFISEFALRGFHFMNGKILPVSLTTP